MLNDAIVTANVLESITTKVHESITLCISFFTITIISNYAKMDINLAFWETSTWCTTNLGTFQESM